MVLGVGLSSLDLAAQYSVQNAFYQLAQVSTRLATGLRVARGSDGPAALIMAQQLSAELAAWQSATETTERTRAVVHVADSAMAHASSMLTDLEANVVAAASDSLTAEQRDALQYEIDASLDALNRLGGTNFAGRRLFGEPMTFLVGSEPHQTETLELPALDDGLGGASGVLADLRSGGAASVDTDPARAQRILSEARTEILSARAEAGAFERYVVDSNQRVMEDTQVSLAAALSAVQDADMAAETSLWARQMILAESAVAAARLTIHARRLISPLLEDLFRAG
jgi:flagellin